VAEATRRLGGIGFFLRADRSVWVFADGQPLVIRRGEHWTAFPLELATAISSAIGASVATVNILVQTAFLISAQRHGAILAIVDDPDSLEGIVSEKDRYDLRDAVDPMNMPIETRLHHLIDAEGLDAQTLARFAALDGATILDRDAHLLAYGAIVTSSDSQHEGARTAAATTLSHTADIVLKVSVDGDITVFRNGEVIATLLG
jgi:DNA integrity scanning protein DisA with diadenylate cyclase activity